MPAIVTDALRTLLARQFFDQFANQTARYYIGIGRSEIWDSSDAVPTPQNTPGEVAAARAQMQSVKKVQATSLVVPRNNWSNGTLYSQYDNTVSGYPTEPYYVMNDNNNVYICLETGRNNAGVAVASTVEPTGSNNDSFRLSDGYVWKFLFTVSASRANSFMSSNFLPVKKQDPTDSSSTGIQLKQEEIQDTALVGAVTSVIITNVGSGYTSNPNVQIIGAGGLGTGAAARTRIDSATGTLAYIKMVDSGTTQKLGSGYTRAEVVISGGGGNGAKARAVLGPDSGVGADARVDLKSAAIMFHSRIEGTDSNFIIDQDFRQVTLIKDIKDNNGVIFTGTTGNTLSKMTLASTVQAFTKDKIIRGQITLAEAYIDNIDSNEIYYHQTSETGFTAFQDGEVINETNGVGQGIVDSAVIPPEVDPNTGDILYIDNRAAVARSNVQAEDVKVIIQF
jgi:hypothetical protein